MSGRPFGRIPRDGANRDEATAAHTRPRFPGSLLPTDQSAADPPDRVGLSIALWDAARLLQPAKNASPCSVGLERSKVSVMTVR